MKLRICHFTAQLSCFVTELWADSDVVLGNAFGIEHRAVPDFANPTMTLTVVVRFTNLQQHIWYIP
jgi:hypothetical protein